MRLLRRTAWLPAVLAASFAIGTLAADSSAAAPSNALPDLSSNGGGGGSSNTGGGSSKTGGDPSNTNANSNTGKGATATATGNSGASTSATKVVITGSGSADPTTGSIPVITGGSTAASGAGALPGLPTLSGAFVIVAPSVPATANAPFMQQSKLPEGTVFIAVGAILGFMAMSVLLWRGLVAWSLHRSVKRAALAQHVAMNDTKALFRAPGPSTAPPFYKYSDRDSTISLSGLGHRGPKKGGRPSTANASASNLFFSPTAGAAGAGLNNPGNRGSNYLPAGYYAAGASQIGNAQSHVPIGGLGHGPAISLSNLGPQTHGYSRSRSMGPSPPDSPKFMGSSSTLNLNTGYGNGQERAPSAYLEDLFDGENAPPVPGHGTQNSASPHRY